MPDVKAGGRTEVEVLLGMDTESPLLSFIKSSLPKMRDHEPLLQRLQDLGVEDLEDLSYLQESDPLSVLRPIEVRKLLSLLKKTSQQDVLGSPPSNQQFSRASTSTSPVTQSDEMHLSGGYSLETTSSPQSTRSSSVGITPRRKSDNSWHFKFQIPWQKIPSEIIRKLETGNRPTKRNSTLAAENFMLSVDQTIVNGHIRIFSDALMLMFGSYYCMNISYPAAQASTLEFLQRCLFKINPDKGSKVERNATKRKLAVSPKVLILITRIADCEWRE
ncbi:uncharacterized protein LOC118556368 isoform X1 [Fundulus heteroclitus]|uniref:uncharacterized protein LOC118556368 isoform X1 n=1 Tax=Fundulus heteroclitus TaxID=8078 RepID=UPI00165B9F2F|nr:uncharacterized protein LOC118556368 isoform X1 [Fundulus heteroclitus]